KCSSADEKLTLPGISLTSVSPSGYDACLRLLLLIKPLPANKTLRIEFNELGIRTFRTLLIQRGRHGSNTLRWKQLFPVIYDHRQKVKIRNRSPVNQHLDIQRECMWELQYDCFTAQAGHTVHVSVYDFNRTLITDSYTVKRPPQEDVVPAYNVKLDLLSKRFIVDLEAGQKVYVRLCYENKALCKGIISNKIDTDLNRTVILNLPYLVPCICVQTYYDVVDARRNTTCPLKNKILPGGGEVLSSSSLQLFGSSVLEWKHLCPLTEFKPAVSLCWQHTHNHSRCVLVQNSTLHVRDLKYNVSDVDKHAHMCLKFHLNESHHVFCPFSSGVLSEWDVTVVPGAQRLYVRLSSSIPASFAAQLCMEKDGACVVEENVHTVQLEEGGRDVELTVPLPFFTSGPCVQVWRSEPALRGRRIICPDYTHRRWGLIVAASLAVLVAITTVGILIYNLVKRQTSAYGLQEELRMDVRLAQWTHCGTQSSLAQLGPAPWLYGQCQQVHGVGGMVLIAWSPKAQHSFLRWRERENAEKVDKDQKDKVPRDQQSQAESQSSITAPVFNAALISLWAGLQSGRHGQGFGLDLTDCNVKPGDICLYHDDRVNVSGLSAHALLCSSLQGLRPCLRIFINVTPAGSHEEAALSGEVSYNDKRGENSLHEHGSGLEQSVYTSMSFQVCYQGPDFSGSKEITFTPLSSDDHTTRQMWISLIVELREDDFGSTVTVFSSNIYKPTFTKDIKLPAIDQVCSQGLAIAQCKVPILFSEINPRTGMAELRVGDLSSDEGHDLQACQRMEKDGPCLRLEWKENPLMIPMSSVAPCLCFQIWWMNGLRKMFCPFLNKTALSVSNISVSVVESSTHDGAMGKNSTALVWSITAPCRLEAEIQLCKKTSGFNKDCDVTDELKNSRDHIHSHQHPKWNLINKQHWQLQGEFAQVERHSSLCVQINVKGIKGHFDLVCPFESARTHWSLFLLVSVLVMCLAVLGAYVLQGLLKAGWIFKWLKMDAIS
ncbi:interleukin-17 receptor C-like isoform X1, partial [Clarias magur]